MAAALLERAWSRDPSAGTSNYVCSCFDGIRDQLDLPSFRVALLRSFTVEPAVPFLRARSFLGGLHLDVKVGGFNTYAQEILDSGSDIYRFEPQAVVLAVQARDIVPSIWEEYPDHDANELRKNADEVVSLFQNLFSTFRANSDAALVVHDLETPAIPSFGAVLDSQNEDGQTALIRSINAGIRRAAAGFQGIYLLGYDSLTARYGKRAWFDPRNHSTVKMPLRAEFLGKLASEWLRFVFPATGRSAKVLVTDLDNTLWGGVIGEDGADGIRIDRGYPGAGYRGLQRAILDRRGVLLAIASKNNPDDALDVLKTHPEMLLRPEHFSSLYIDWNDKAANLRRIANELNVGTDSLVFLDDNEAERELVRQELPEVTVIELPKDPMQYEEVLRDCPVFERFSLSAEDTKRQQYYAGQKLRNELQHTSSSLEDFYRSLSQVVDIQPVNDESLARASQLTMKTNQFNLTTRRYNEAQLADFLRAPASRAHAVKVSDRFGDNGITGLYMTTHDGKVCEIDTFLLSCRVIGRTVETAVLAHLLDYCRKQGIEEIRGWYLPTKKNKPAESVYSDHGFTRLESDGANTLWSLRVSGSKVQCPTWIRMKSTEIEDTVHA
jgi:FkbH-like protein